MMLNPVISLSRGWWGCHVCLCHFHLPLPLPFPLQALQAYLTYYTIYLISKHKMHPNQKLDTELEQSKSLVNDVRRGTWDISHMDSVKWFFDEKISQSPHQYPKH